MCVMQGPFVKAHRVLWVQFESYRVTLVKSHSVQATLTQLQQPALQLLHGGLEPRLLAAHAQTALGVEDVEGVHRLQLDLHAELLQHPQEVQHKAVRGDQLVVRLGGERDGAG